ncbi:MAG: mercuric transporter MerT family protein [Methylocystis sp.]|uniref:mercuric transporter MerT family protein n=1 Tax=Methylocystis sp. TaxID=1911079 RepID=UPI003D0A5DA7
MAVSDATKPNGKAGPLAPATGWFAWVGTAVGFWALAASSCCALPLALASVGVTGAALGGLELLASLRPFLLGGAALAIAIGWFLFFRRRVAACDNADVCVAPGSPKRTAAFLAVGTALIGAAAIWQPYVEPILLQFMRQR